MGFEFTVFFLLTLGTFQRDELRFGQPDSSSDAQFAAAMARNTCSNIF
ncbi:hypothetical protein C7S13_4787 [Burkholderia cepacia]|nr:hypothetical protein [Burkholderia cepacia]